MAGPGAVMVVANALAAALLRADFVAVRALLSEDVALWTASRERLGPSAGCEKVTETLRRLVESIAPTRIRVLRSASRSVVLSALADETAIWSIELAVELSRIDSMMVRLPDASPALRT